MMEKHDPEPRDPSESENGKGPKLGLPPLRMVLTGDEHGQPGKTTAERRGAAGARLVESAGPSGELDNERVVRRIIEHLLKEV